MINFNLIWNRLTALLSNTQIGSVCSYLLGQQNSLVGYFNCWNTVTSFLHNELCNYGVIQILGITMANLPQHVYFCYRTIPEPVLFQNFQNALSSAQGSFSIDGIFIFGPTNTLVNAGDSDVAVYLVQNSQVIKIP